MEEEEEEMSRSDEAVVQGVGCLECVQSSATVKSTFDLEEFFSQYKTNFKSINLVVQHCSYHNHNNPSFLA
jgi:hypothetical protein